MASKNSNKENVPKYILRIDRTSEEGVTYLGRALPGSSETGLVWQIQKLTDSYLLFAKGNDLFDKQWSERTNYTYS